MSHKNEVHLAGVLARDPELHHTPSGKAVANFTVGTTYEKKTEWHRCVAWEQNAEKLGETFHNGDFIRLVGRLQTRSWEDKQTGQRKYITEVIAFQISGEELKPPITPDPNRTEIARAILAPSKTNGKEGRNVRQ